jgi:hypothetical protein
MPATPRHSITQLYHLAEMENLPSILEHGLLSTQHLVSMSGLPAREQKAFLCTHRRTNVRLPTGVVVRDQIPMPPSALGPALDDGMTPSDWYELLNAHVFLWSDNNRMQRQRKACGGRPQVVLTFDAEALFYCFSEMVLLAPINTGNARRKPARRSRATLMPYQAWLNVGWPTGRRWRPPAEVLFTGAVPTIAPFLMTIDGP